VADDGHELVDAALTERLDRRGIADIIGITRGKKLLHENHRRVLALIGQRGSGAGGEYGDLFLGETSEAAECLVGRALERTLPVGRDQQDGQLPLSIAQYRAEPKRRTKPLYGHAYRPAQQHCVERSHQCAIAIGKRLRLLSLRSWAMGNGFEDCSLIFIELFGSKRFKSSASGHSATLFARRERKETGTLCSGVGVVAAQIFCWVADRTVVREFDVTDFDELARRAHARTWQHASVLIGPDLAIRWASDNIALVIGWERGDLVGRPAHEFLHPDDIPGVLEILSVETTLNPLWRAQVKRRMVRQLRALGPDGGYIDLECTLTNLLQDPEVGMLLLDVELPSQFRYLDTTVELTRVGADIRQILSLILDQFTTGGPSQPAAIVADHEGVLLAATPNAPEPYGSATPSIFVETWQRELFDSTTVNPVGVARFWCPLATAHPFDIAAAEQVSRQAAVAIGRHRANAELVKAAHNDVLTGISNRRALEQELQRRLGQNDEVLLAYLDLDGFKDVNDRLGHAAGDHVLRIVADRLASSLRATDVAARIGGDEFVLLFGAPAPSIDVIGDRLAISISAPITWGDELIQISVSIGFGSGATDADALLRSADRAMLSAKRRR
jgi:diguanylate cyclase (GGDEF)-like protein